MSILVATASGLVCDGETVALQGEDVTALAPRSHGWLAVTHRSEVHAIGPDWNVDLLGTISGIDAIAEFGGQPVAGTESARLFEVSGDARPDAAFDSAPDRSDWYTPSGGPPTVRSMAEGPDGLRWVNVHVGGVLVGDGSGWRPTMDVDNDVHQVIAHPRRPATAYCAAAVGLGWTTDGGSTWEWSTAGLHATYSRAIAVSGELVFLSASRGPSGRDAALYRGTPGEPLEPCDAAGRHDQNIDSGCVAAHGRLIAVAAPGGTVYASSDSGETWEKAFKVERPRALGIVPE
ncbi:MAG TPA: hypothetical protein VK960_00305 [Acidimicrobiia bacterium]|nr:hypothetical protein [Acidimicrobiia bacterium]